MTTMNILLSVSVITLSTFAAFMPAFVAFAPAIFGPQTTYRLHLKRLIIHSLTLGIVLTNYFLYPSSTAIVLLGVWGVLVLITLRLNPPHVIRSLDYPPRVAASDAILSADELVVGFSGEDNAIAWPESMIIPHHLINDQIGGIPILVAH